MRLPEDDDARLVLADALEQAGDPLGPWIALHVALSQLPPEEDEERERLDAEAADYLTEHGDAICAFFGLSQRTCRFERGEPVEVELTAHQLSRALPTLSERAAVRRLRVVHTARAADALREALAMEGGSTIREWIFPERLPVGLPEAFGAWPHAVEVLEGHLTAGEIERLLRQRTFAGLRSLRLLDEALTPEVAALLPDSLRELTVRSASPAALAALVARPCCARLERLSVDAAEEVEGWFTLLLTATSLRALDLGTAWSTVQPLEGVAPLRTLRFSSTRPVADVERLFAIDELGSVETLWVGGLRLSLAVLEALARSGWRQVREFSATACGIDAEAVVPLARWLPDSIRSLGLASNELGDEGTVRLATSPNLAGLRDLDLSSCAMGGRGVMALAEVRWTRLRTLRLSSNPLGDSVAALVDAPGLARLRLLSLYEPGASRATWRALRKRFGDVLTT